jgi:hypothetical protein
VGQRGGTLNFKIELSILGSLFSFNQIGSLPEEEKKKKRGGGGKHFI